MKDKFLQAFDKVQAEEALKERTMDRLRERLNKKSVGKWHAPIRFAVAVACCLLFVIVGGFSYNVYYAASAYVDMDVNPSIELVVNRFDRVIGSWAYNEEGSGILSGVNLDHMQYDEAVQVLLEQMIQQAYLQQNPEVSISVQADEEREVRMVATLDAAIAAQLETYGTAARTEIFAVSEEVRAHAHEYNVTPAKHLAIEALMQVDPSASYESCADHSVGEIRQMVREHGKEHHGGTQNKEEKPTESGENGGETDKNKDSSHGHGGKGHH